MSNNIINKEYQFFRLLTLFCLLSVLFSCKKADKFYDTLNTLPQIDYTTKYAYKPVYIIGDTMVISGRLQPENNLQISVGGIAAKIIKTGLVSYPKGDINNTLAWMDQVSFLITSSMEGISREVKVTSGGYSIIGSPVDVYSQGGIGSFSDSLKAVTVKTLSSNQIVMLYCRNGKGDIYYYGNTTKDLRHLKKDGTEEVLIDFTKSIDPNSTVLVNSVLAGGVDALGHYLYFSGLTSQGYRFCKFDLSTKQITTLNQSVDTSAPFEGSLAQVHMVVTGVYPDAKGNVYVAIGFGNTISNRLRDSRSLPDAIARYTVNDGQLNYVYKGIVPANTFAGMPGTRLTATVQSFYYSPDENLLYAIEGSAGTSTVTYELFDLTAGTSLQSVTITPVNALFYNVVGPFSGLAMDIGINADHSFGYLPMPGKRLQTLLYQYILPAAGGANDAAKKGFPKWTVFDFSAQRTYAYAPGRFNPSGNAFLPTILKSGTVNDQLLNTDEDGNLYMTANGKTTIIKTQTIQ